MTGATNIIASDIFLLHRLVEFICGDNEGLRGKILAVMTELDAEDGFITVKYVIEVFNPKNPKRTKLHECYSTEFQFVV